MFWYYVPVGGNSAWSPYRDVLVLYLFLSHETDLINLCITVVFEHDLFLAAFHRFLGEGINKTLPILIYILKFLNRVTLSGVFFFFKAFTPFDIVSRCCCLVAWLCWLFVTPRTVAHWAPLSMGFPRQEYCNRLLFPSPGDLSNPGIETVSPALAGNSLPL